ncbi:unnamed protein product [Cochlearia groenlandica]
MINDFVFAKATTQHESPCNFGLDSSLLQSILVLAYKSKDLKDGLECTVCVSDLVNGDKARVLPKCGFILILLVLFVK